METTFAHFQIQTNTDMSVMCGRCDKHGREMASMGKASCYAHADCHFGIRLRGREISAPLSICPFASIPPSVITTIDG